MPGLKYPVVEIEKLLITDDGRGIVLYNDGTNFLKGRVWTGIPPSTNSTRPKALPAASSSGWLKICTMSGSTNTESTYYIPLYSNVDTNLSS